MVVSEIGAGKKCSVIGWSQFLLDPPIPILSRSISLFQKLQQFNAAAATPLRSFLASIPVCSYFAIRQQFTKKCVNLTLPPRRKKLTFRGVQ